MRLFSSETGAKISDTEKKGLNTKKCYERDRYCPFFSLYFSRRAAIEFGPLLLSHQYSASIRSENAFIEIVAFLT